MPASNFAIAWSPGFSELGSSEDAAKWAHQRLAEKNCLRAPDAQRVEVIFETKLIELAASAGDRSRSREERPVDADASDAGKSNERVGGKVIDKSAFALPEPRRIRDRNHVRFVALQPCAICARLPFDAHHLRFAQSRALGRKVSDEFTVPLCRGHHREAHRCGDEAAWWSGAGFDAIGIARALWLETHPIASAPHGIAAETVVPPITSPTALPSSKAGHTATGCGSTANGSMFSKARL